MAVDENAGHRKKREVALQESTKYYEVEVGKDRTELKNKSDAHTVDTQDLKDILLAPEIAGQ